MTIFPMYLSNYPNMNSSFPFYLSINEVKSAFPSHRHDYLEFSLVIEGFGVEIINGKKHIMEPGTFTFLLPYQIHEIIAEPATPLKLYNCIFDLNLLLGMELDSLLSSSDTLELQPFIKLDETNFKKMKLLLDGMMEEYEDSMPFKQVMLKAKMAEVFVLFERIRRKAHPASVEYNGFSKKEAIWPILRYIHLHYQEDITLSNIAKQFHVSLSYLSELFKEHVGQNFVAFLQELRIRHACSLLASTNITITEIALEVGYGSFKTFSRVFREQKNMTPTAFRKLHKGSLTHNLDDKVQTS